MKILTEMIKEFKINPKISNIRFNFLIMFCQTQQAYMHKILGDMRKKQKCVSSFKIKLSWFTL